jgi:hypothetical protein
MPFPTVLPYAHEVLTNVAVCVSQYAHDEPPPSEGGNSRKERTETTFKPCFAD